ncbi:cilia- and flagella-associated protein 161-like [Chironomus tepperi]|uniref:cilia- and flagella-associated protein 161-like n=1 Tax=Chironomus tepperi TaxID=113505 RepID=UPI00391F997C
MLVADEKADNLKCLVGNWPSKQLLQKHNSKREEEELSEFVKKREKGELLIQKTARLYENFLAPIQQQPLVEKTFIAFDQIVQLIACEMPTMSPQNEPLALSVVANEPHINECQEIDQQCGLSCAPSSQLITRNAFVIRHPINQRQKSQHDAFYSSSAVNCNLQSSVEYLKYGQDFTLECYASNKQQRNPLLVYSMPKNPFASSMSNNVAFKSKGEMKQFVGLALQKSHISADNSKSMANMKHHALTSTDESIPTAFFHWRIHHANPEIRYEMIGENIPECGVSCHTERNIYGKETESNIWQISAKTTEF